MSASRHWAEWTPHPSGAAYTVGIEEEVMLLDQLGLGYPWRGENIDWRYVEEKWTYGKSGTNGPAPCRAGSLRPPSHSPLP